jgi:hypothetical protein
VSISATSTPSCDVPLISPTAKIEAAGEADAIWSDITEKAFQDFRIIAAFCITRETCYTAALTPRGAISIATRTIPKSGHRFSDKIVRKYCTIPKSGHRFSDKIMRKYCMIPKSGYRFG